MDDAKPIAKKKWSIQIATDKPVPFTMRGLPLLSSGASFDPLATAENLWLSVKVYSSGGENALHAHMAEDHAFVALQGRATFHFEDGSTQTIRQFEGVMLPKGVFYRFEAGEEENLVLMRIGAAQRKTKGFDSLARHGSPTEITSQTIDHDGSKKNARDAKTGTPAMPIIEIPGKFFAPD